jgi:thiol:disulfide interchange protein DsbD
MKIVLGFLLLVLLLSCSDKNKQKEIDVNEKVRYGELFRYPYNIKGYFDYDQALLVAQKENKPLLVRFVSHVLNRDMERAVWSDPEVLKILKNDYLVVSLYVDDKTVLPEEEWITSGFDGRVKKTMGQKNLDFQITRFKVNAQPYFVLLNLDETLLVQPYAYNIDVAAYVKFLRSGLASFQNTRE